MTKAQLIALGIPEELAQKAADASAEELKGYVPQAKHDEALQTIKAHAETIAGHDKQLATLKKTAEGNEALTAQIAQLQADNKAKDETHQKELKEMRISTALKLALTGKVHDVDMTAGLLDKTKIELDDNGGVKAGLKEQIESLQKSKAFLFVPEQPPNPTPPLPKGITPADGSPPTGGDKATFPFNFQTVRPLPKAQ